MATYRMTARPTSSVVTMTFDYYNQAAEFTEKSCLLGPSKPYKRGAKWAVSLPGPITKAKYVKLPHWEKPNSKYNEWRSVEALYHLPLPPPLPKIEARQDEEEYA